MSDKVNTSIGDAALIAAAQELAEVLNDANRKIEHLIRMGMRVEIENARSGQIQIQLKPDPDLQSDLRTRRFEPHQIAQVHRVHPDELTNLDDAS
ncbi:hypothetical protein [Pseudosulfitobacter pseudonitzschiae]|uniref:hypothetical protein n=1 Tax=Pseudosulfitobacter pseudonitzschiae TaxID=1402135 RepID=UPI001AF7AE6B|nr:hypothetical protein [Pseudosulfitobacter pseudonitzschiae]MBM1813438.1 hypothetical protein [Pseudosulfitobacter pseudonitzschiae]MBM1830431.1 hypothetical protein [Pseudosulfitobacter pseudonitzschiae]MBM1835298.1 hypothetical protein [Pseudosulfitobacter pseudonitzschiae]MBM1840144.1 hypothetical protein [Pseudosulfitobacter pseudonitzschiae]MBM1845868.1 hypothetical protein [Pseudosulfitobacter pseudonitzschiae]